eukprot:5866612-Amphidinium_carterae.1
MAQSSASPSEVSVSMRSGGGVGVDGGTMNCRMMLSYAAVMSMYRLAEEWRLLLANCVSWLEMHNGKQTPPPATSQNWLALLQFPFKAQELYRPVIAGVELRQLLLPDRYGDCPCPMIRNAALSKRFVGCLSQGRGESWCEVAPHGTGERVGRGPTWIELLDGCGGLLYCEQLLRCEGGVVMWWIVEVVEAVDGRW